MVTVCNMSESLTPTFPVPDPELHVFGIAEGGGIVVLIKQTHRRADIMPKPLNLMMVLSVPQLRLLSSSVFVNDTSSVQSVPLTLLELTVLSASEGVMSALKPAEL